VPLGNGTEKYPDGDFICVIERWKPYVVIMSWDKIERALDAIDAGTNSGTEFYSSAKQSARWGGNVIMSQWGVSSKKAGVQLDEWIAAGVLVQDTYTSPKTRHVVERLAVDFDAKLRLQQRAA
jgi:hypothetical protein